MYTFYNKIYGNFVWLLKLFINPSIMPSDICGCNVDNFDGKQLSLFSHCSLVD